MNNHLMRFAITLLNVLTFSCQSSYHSAKAMSCSFIRDVALLACSLQTITRSKQYRSELSGE